ncbi:hypothetical protein [Streptomyces sp. OK228]|uniref:hypothetical protein n=1 Tax=Streptomyces sp. OK228 TaxID=1882786 RepID=UPI00117CDEF3|nr:hypothetical protein [Streptomyces sp. OK228]
MLAMGPGRFPMNLPLVTLPATISEETSEMNTTVELKCWTCEQPFSVEVGPGRPRRYCDPDCKKIARAEARRARYVARLEQERLSRAKSN